MTIYNNTPKFRYSLEHIDFTKISSVKDVLLLLKEHDYDSFVYSYRTAAISYAIVWSDGERDHTKLTQAFKAGLLHDVGKLGMSFKFINYPGSYTNEMFDEMKKHSLGGASILENVKADTELIEVARYHHRNFDGTGYGGELLKENDIPYLARVVRIADSLDAYLTKRCYKDGGPTLAAFDDLNQFNGKSYDPHLLEVFRSVHNKVVEACHSLGEDNPSQDFYMNKLINIFLKNFPAKTADEALDLF